MPDSNCMMKQACKMECNFEATVIGNVEGLSLVVLADRASSRK